MKKLIILSAVAVVAASAFVSCDSNKPQEPVLKTQIDSLNYAFGLANGKGIKDYYMQNDSTNTAVESLLKGLEEGMSGKASDFAEMEEIGTNIGSVLKEQTKSGLMNDSTVKVDIKIIKQGLINGMKGSTIQMTAEEANAYLNATMQKKQEAKMDEEFKENRIAGEMFLVENAKRPEVTTTASGLQYEVITMGKGAKPESTSSVKVHYHGTLIDGTVFDSSVDRGEPIVFGLNQVIPGWTEGLQLMPVGSKFKLYIPQALAYGKQNTGTIKPFSTLIFEVELIAIEK